MTIDFKFAIGDIVKIKALSLPGTVIAACHRGFLADVKYKDLNDYRIIYWADSKRFDEWLFEFELE